MNKALLLAIRNFMFFQKNASQEELDKIDMELLRELEKAKFYCPVASKPLNNPQAEALVFDEGQDITFILLQDEKEDKYFPAFTELERLENYGFENVRALEITMKDFSNIFLKDKNQGIVINPNEENFIMDKNMILSVGKKSIFEDVGKNEELVFILPKSQPDKLFKKLSDFFSKLDEVKEATFLLVKKSGRNGFLFIVDHDYEDEVEFFNSIYELSEATFRNELIYIVSKDEELFQNAAKLNKPFYSAKNSKKGKNEKF